MLALLRRFLPLLSLACLPAAAAPVPVGAARVDITPALPIRLTGYPNRATEATNVAAPLSARALALGGDEGEGPVVLVVAEVLGVSEAFTAGVLADLQARRPLPRERFALAVTHQHNGPAIAGTAPFLFSRDLPADELARIDAYTAFLRQRLVEVALAALAARRPAELGWARGRWASPSTGAAGSTAGTSATPTSRAGWSTTTCPSCGRPARTAASAPCCSTMPATARP